MPASVTIALKKRCWQLTGMALIGAAVIMGVAVLSYAPGDPSFNSATDNAPINLAGHWGAVFSDLVLQIVGYAALIVPLAALFQWIVLSVLRGQPLAPLATVTGSLLTIAVFPLVANILVRLQRALLRAPPGGWAADA